MDWGLLQNGVSYPSDSQHSDMPRNRFVRVCIVKDHRNCDALKPVFLAVLVDGLRMRWMTRGIVVIFDDVRLAAREYAIEVVFNI